MDKSNPILVLSKRKKISITRVSEHLGVSSKMLYRYIKNPNIMQLKHLIILSGIFNITPEKMLYLLIINKAKDRRTKEEIKEIETSIKTA